MTSQPGVEVPTGGGAGGGNGGGASGGGNLVGQSLGDYLLRGVLGVGGMAEVYRAMDLTLEREVAVKVLPVSFAADPGYVQRFRDEAKQVAALNHPHIVPIYAFGEERGYFYHVMPMLHGSLRDRLLQDGHLAPEEAVRLVRQIASALEAAHALGLVHRDVKPENILLDAEGNALLTDFGIARELTALRRAGATRTLTGNGLPIGTPEYMAPEQLRYESYDQRADIYGLGAVLYELLCGVAPHEAASPFEVAALALSAPILPPSQRDPRIWPALEQVVLKALALDPADRYPDMQSFSAALELALHRTDALWSATTLPPLSSPVPRRAHLALRPRTSGSVMAVVLVLVLVLVVAALGTGYLALRMAGVGGGTHSTLGTPALAISTATASATTPLPTVTPRPKPTAPATATTPASPPLPSPTATPKPAPNLVISPTPLVLNPGSSGGGGNVCSSTQTITNTTHQTVGWQWLNQQGGFHFQVNGGQQMDWPKDVQPGLAPGGTDTLIATTNCQPAGSQPKLYSILLTDSLHDQYTFVLQVQPASS